MARVISRAYESSEQGRALTLAEVGAAADRRPGPLRGERRRVERGRAGGRRRRAAPPGPDRAPDALGHPRGGPRSPRASPGAGSCTTSRAGQSSSIVGPGQPAVDRARLRGVRLGGLRHGRPLARRAAAARAPREPDRGLPGHGRGLRHLDRGPRARRRARPRGVAGPAHRACPAPPSSARSSSTTSWPPRASSPPSPFCPSSWTSRPGSTPGIALALGVFATAVGLVFFVRPRPGRPALGGTAIPKGTLAAAVGGFLARARLGLTAVSDRRALARSYGAALVAWAAGDPGRLLRTCGPSTSRCRWG